MAPSLLLDTYALLWWLVEPEKLSALAHAAINDPAATIFVSAATGWELATKVRLGQLHCRRTWAEQSWAEDREGFRTCYPQEENLREARNRIEALLLIQKSINASESACSYAQKRSQYVTQNILAQSFCDQAYQNNPAFLAFLQRSGLSFQSEPEFTPEALERRNQLNARFAQRIWSVDNLVIEPTGVGSI